MDSTTSITKTSIATSAFRTLISAMIVAGISIGNTLQASMSSGEQQITKWQLYSALIGGAVLFLNDIKSRLTPTASEETK